MSNLFSALQKRIACLFVFLGGELKATADETLFLELALRSYEPSKLREEETTAEFVKIG